MKRLSILTFLIISATCLSAQVLNQLFVELDIGRYSKPTGLFESSDYPFQFSYLNGFNLGYHHSVSQDYFVGFRKLDDYINFGGGFTREISNNEGLELSLGFNYTPKNKRNFFLSYGIMLFGEFAKLKGTYWVDYPPNYEINHRKTVIGLAPGVTINFSLTDKILLFAKTRVKVGRASVTRIEQTLPGYELYPSRLFWSIIYEPIQSIGVRFNL